MTLNERLRSGAITKKVLATRVHYTEHLLLHRPIRAGDRLSISGAIAALLPHRAGTHAVIRLEARDPGGAPVFTEYLGAMFRGVSCSAEKGVENLPVPPEKPEQQDPGWEAAIDLPELSPYIYDGCTGIVFPIHTSPAFAKSVGLPGIIVQGTLTLAKALNEIVNREAGGDPLRVAEISVRFTGMVLPKTSIRVRKTGSSAIKGETAVFFEVLNADGEKAIRGGYARLR
jgi:acyl dehydratase